MHAARRSLRTLIEMHRLPLSLDLEQWVTRGDEHKSWALLIPVDQPKLQHPEFFKFRCSQMRCKCRVIWMLKRSLADNSCVLNGKCYSSKWSTALLPTTLKLACGVFVPGGREGCWVPHRFLTAVLQWLMKQTAMMYQSSVRMKSSLKIQWEHHWFKNREKVLCLSFSIHHQ